VIDTTLAKRYAKALVEIGQEQNALDKYGQDLTNIVDLMQGSKDFSELLISPVFTKEDKKRIADEILQKIDTARMVANFINLLIDRKRIDQLPGIEQAFREKVDDMRGITRGEVTSAEPLGDPELAKVTEVLSTISGKQVQITANVDPTLIGGLVAKVGDRVFDGTIRTQLNQLKESLKG
jgi:F-type H+-transporting ATPase subunit delta